MRLADGWHGRPVKHAPAPPRLLSAFQVRSQRHSRRKAGDILGRVFGPLVPRSFLLVVTSPPSYGKSTWVLRALESGAWETPVCVVAEEGIEGAGLASRCERLEVTRTSFSDAQSFPEVCELVELHKPDVIALDSVTALGLTPDDCLSLRRGFPGLSVVAVVQSTKGGGHLGPQSWKHDADAFLELPEPGRFKVTKSWFSELKEGDL